MNCSAAPQSIAAAAALVCSMHRLTALEGSHCVDKRKVACTDQQIAGMMCLRGVQPTVHRYDRVCWSWLHSRYSQIIDVSTRRCLQNKAASLHSYATFNVSNVLEHSLFADP